MKLWQEYLNILTECGDASEYNELPNGEEPDDVGKTKDKIEDELVDEDFDLDESKNWIAAATKRKGALHRSLGVPEGEKIPKSKLEVHKGDSTRLKKEKVLAKNLSHLHKK